MFTKTKELVRRLELDVIGHNTKLGRIRWLQGEALEAAKQGCKHGEWKDLLHELGLAESTVYLLRVIADKVDEKDSYNLGFDEMRAIAFPKSYKKRRKSFAL